MLHRSFKPAKCKIALKLAVSRIKLLKNKRETQVKQLKRELAQLLESGQDQTARIRVEHVVREEKTMAAYDLVEIYCELIAARLPMIESQKNCPIDLKEAISSVIFASPRCSDIPELKDVQKHMTAKYGKEFVSAAVELRPDCGVNRLLVEKLSAKAPDGPTKIKILAAIAEEHNVKWEPKSFGENDVKSQDLLVGPNTFENATYVEPSQVHVPPVRDEKGPPNLHASSQAKPMHDISTNSYEQNASIAARMAGGNQSTTSDRSNPEIRSSGAGSQEVDFRDSYIENRSAFSTGRQNWSMEFKDAASAAQAAAESAERASMAARAAAELSNRENMTRQHSSGSHSSSGSRLRDEVPLDHAFHEERHISTDSVNSTFHRSSSGVHNEQITAIEQDSLEGEPDGYYRNGHEKMEKHAQSASLKYSNAIGDDNPFASGSRMADISPRNSSFGQENSDLHEVSIKKQASRIDVDFVTEQHGDGDMNTKNNYHFGDTKTNQQSSKASSSYIINPSDDNDDDLNLYGQHMGNKALVNTFSADEGNTQRNTMETSSYNNTSVVFDDSGSEDDDYEFVVDKKYEVQGSSLFSSSPGSKSQVDTFADTNAWSHRHVIDEKESSSSSHSHLSVVSERLTKSAVSSGKEDLLPVTFDDSDDPGSDSELDLVNPKVSVSFDYGNSLLERSANHGALESSSQNDKNVGSDRKSWLSRSSDGSDTLEEHFDRKIDISAASEKNFVYDDLPARQPSSRGNNSVLDFDLKANIHESQSPDTFNDTETLEESSIESSKELNYGPLKGGLRNKGYRRPPYIKNTSDSSSLGEISLQNEQTLPTMRTLISSAAPAQEKYVREVSGGNRSLGLTARNTSSDSDSYDLVASSQGTQTSTYDPRTQKDQSEAKRKSSSRASITYFDSDNSDSEDELTKQNSVSLARPVSGFSRRTSASSKTGTGLSRKDAPLSGASVTSGTGLGWKSSRVSYESKNQKGSPMMKSSENGANSGFGSAEHAASKSISEPNRSSREEIVKSSARLQSSSSVPKTVIPDTEEGQEASKSLNSDGDIPSKQKPDHVHPKLPDYDSFAAHFLALKKGRQ